MIRSRVRQISGRHRSVSEANYGDASKDGEQYGMNDSCPTLTQHFRTSISHSRGSINHLHSTGGRKGDVFKQLDNSSVPLRNITLSVNNESVPKVESKLSVSTNKGQKLIEEETAETGKVRAG